MRAAENKRLWISVFLLALSILIVFFSFFLLKFILPIEEKDISAELTVGKVAAFNLDNRTMSFGTITPSVNANREIFIENGYSFPITVSLRAEGNITKFLVLDKKFFLNLGESKKIKIETVYPSEKDEGFYSGNVVVVLKRAY